MSEPHEYLIDLGDITDANTNELFTPPGDKLFEPDFKSDSVYFTGPSFGTPTSFRLLQTDQMLVPLTSSQGDNAFALSTSNAFDQTTFLPHLPVSSLVLSNLPCECGEVSVFQSIEQSSQSTNQLNRDNLDTGVLSTPTNYQPPFTVAFQPVMQSIKSGDVAYTSNTTPELTAHVADVRKTNNAVSSTTTAATISHPWFVPHEVTPEQLESDVAFSRKPPNRTKKNADTVRIVYSADCDPLFSDSKSKSVHLDNFWCPMCRTMCGSSGCPNHAIVEQPDTPVTSYARLSKPNCMRLVDESGSTRIRVLKRQRALTRYGPLVAPTISEDELGAHPEWLPDCPFRMEVLDSDGQPSSTRYLKLGDEAVCNWMMFVRLICQPLHQLTSEYPLPNAVAFQHGSKGIFFMTTRRIFAGEELVVTYAPQYAARFELPQSVVEVDQNDQLPNIISAIKTRSVPDEIHCFRCSITFNSEDAFHIHRLGHPGELDQRGICPELKTVVSAVDQPDTTCSNPVTPSTTLIELRKPDNRTRSRLGKTRFKTAYFQSTLLCSLCATEVTGLPGLIEHTNKQHAVLKPQIFKPRANRCAVIDEGQFSMTDFIRTVPVDASTSEEVCECDAQSSVNGLVVVDLSRLNHSRFNDASLAYGCGHCGQRFRDMHVLEGHKHAVHGVQTSVKSTVNLDRHSFMQPLYCSDPPATSLSLSFLRGQEPLNEYTDSPIQMVLSDDWIPATTTGAYDDILGMDPPSPSNLASCTNEPTVADPVNQNHPCSTNQTTFECCVCGLLVRTRCALSVHMRSHNCTDLVPIGDRTHCADVDFPSQICSEKRSRRVAVFQRRSFFCCNVCGEGQKSQQTLRAHGKKHRRASDGLFPCPVCPAESNRVYKKFEQLQRHTRFVHSKQIFPCPYCSWTFGRRKNLTNHLVRHTGRRDFLCPFENCKKSFARKDKLNTHLKMHERLSWLTENT
ncbi:hypothetical protein EG68_05085 [Paragonimus skrjabini miyazakii]|uniref:Zinc finger protein n=1 Tax=Paragonimus skrjabini miyazakii TaxID=59628 RepID=A0A8S9YSJ5_9TREM|nr:hypothetical protein EG68_05085 [Paragonimus skrjabini miyazakii]